MTRVRIPVDLMILEDSDYKRAKEKFPQLTNVWRKDFEKMGKEYIVFDSFLVETDVDYPFWGIDFNDSDCDDCNFLPSIYKKLMEEYFLDGLSPAMQYAEVTGVIPFSDLDMDKNGIVSAKSGKLGEMGSKIPIGVASAWAEFFFKGYFDDDSEVDLERIFYINDEDERVLVTVPKNETLKIPKEKVLEKAFDTKIYKSLKDADVSLVDAVEKYSAHFYNQRYMRLRSDFKRKAVGVLR